MSALLPEGAVHLVGDPLAEGHRYGTYIALCRALLPASGLPALTLSRRVRPCLREADGAAA